MNIDQAVAHANASHQTKTMNASKDHCACRGKCGNHAGPCMAACMEGCSTCKSCKQMKAGGPGSGRKGFDTMLPGGSQVEHHNNFEKPVAYTPPKYKPTKSGNSDFHP